MCTLEHFSFRRGDEEPCTYYDEESKVRMLHHVDDGRVAGPRQEHTAAEVIRWLGQFMLLKVSPPIEVYDCFTYLGRKRVRLERGWMTTPAPKHRRRVLQALGLGDLPAGKVKIPPTPGVTRAYVEEEEEESNRELWECRSATGSLFFPSSDV